MKLSFHDEESLKESVGSLNFNKTPSDPDSLQGVGSNNSSSMPLEEPEKNEDPNIILEVWREPVGSSSSPSQERSEDILV